VPSRALRLFCLPTAAEQRTYNFPGGSNTHAHTVFQWCYCLNWLDRFGTIPHHALPRHQCHSWWAAIPLPWSGIHHYVLSLWLTFWAYSAAIPQTTATSPPSAGLIRHGALPLLCLPRHQHCRPSPTSTYGELVDVTSIFFWCLARSAWRVPLTNLDMLPDAYIFWFALLRFQHSRCVISTQNNC